MLNNQLAYNVFSLHIVSKLCYFREYRRRSRRLTLHSAGTQPSASPSVRRGTRRMLSRTNMIMFQICDAAAQWHLFTIFHCLLIVSFSVSVSHVDRYISSSCMGNSYQICTISQGRDECLPPSDV